MTLMSPRVADISRNCVSGIEMQRHLPGHAALLVAVVVELVHHHAVGEQPLLAHGEVGEDLRGAADDRRVAVDAASPVIMPTFSAPNASHSAKNFSFTSALMGQV